MKGVLIYLLQMIAASGILYGYYHFFLRNKKFHRYNRFYLLAAVIISIAIPSFNIPVYFSKESADSSIVLQTLNAFSPSGFDESSAVTVYTDPINSSYNWFSWLNIVYSIYALVVLIFLFRIFLSVRKIKIISTTYPSEKIGDIYFVNTNEPGTPFSFFRWLFWNNEIELNSDKGQQIFRHELFHINQKHTLDIFFIEIITALAWFNPFFHLIKKEIKTIHEFLADEYAMLKSENWQYAELLLMQALNTKLHLVNPFFHNQIKRRIAMITSSQKPGHQYLRKLLVLPVAAILAVLFAFSYKNRNVKDDSIIRSNETITIVVDAAHGGIDKGALSVDGKYTEAQLALEISKTIQQLSSEYNINVVMTRDEDKLPGNVSTIKQGLDKRVEIAKSANPTAYISVHLNAFPLNKPTNLTGFDFYVSADKYKGNSKSLASHMMNEIEKFYTTRGNISPMKNGSFYIFDHLNIPAVAVECGFINNSNDLNFVIDKSNQQKIARAILNAVSQFANNSINIPADNLIDTPKSKKPDTLASFQKYSPPTKKTPTREQLKKWTDSKVYGVWIDNKRIENSLLIKYKPEDFGLYYESKLTKTALNYGKHYYQVDLYTNNYTREKIIDNAGADWQEPTFPGGVVAWRKYLEKNLNTLVPTNNGAKAGTYTVQIKFLVDTAGAISNLIALTKHGCGMEEEVIRAFSKGPKWIPAKQNGHFVNAYKTQPVTFVIIEEDKTPTSRKVVNGAGLKSDKPFDNTAPAFEKVETPPSFPGGVPEWRKYLTKNLNSAVPVDSGAKAGTYTVKVKFIVHKDGSISSIEPLTKHGYGMEEEVIRVISKGPKWEPAKQNGRVVNAYHTQPVTFVIVEDDKDDGKKSQPIITKASFPGGHEAWKAYLKRNLKINIPIDKRSPQGSYTVSIQFEIDKEGHHTNYKALSKLGYGMEEEAIRIIKEGPKVWMPASQNGKPISSTYTAYVSFFVDRPSEAVAAPVAPSQEIQQVKPPFKYPEVSVKDLQKATAYDLTWVGPGTEISSFIFSTDNDAGTIDDVPNYGNTFNSRIKELIGSTKPGRTITIEQIKVVINGINKRIPSKVYFVTN